MSDSWLSDEHKRAIRSEGINTMLRYAEKDRKKWSKLFYLDQLYPHPEGSGE